MAFEPIKDIKLPDELLNGEIFYIEGCGRKAIDPVDQLPAEPDRHRELATALQYHPTSLILGLQIACTRGYRLAISISSWSRNDEPRNTRECNRYMGFAANSDVGRDELLSHLNSPLVNTC